MTVKMTNSYSTANPTLPTEIIESPFYHIEVKPTILHAPSCVAVGIPETMYAGYDYSFLIQGRDVYLNNIADYLETAVGVDNSIVFSPISGSALTVDANARITDDSPPGVYLVKVSLPKKLQEGDYDLKILLGGV